MYSSEFEDFTLYFPSIAKNVVRSKVLPSGDLEVLLKDGMRFYFSPLHQTIRRLPDDPNNLTDQESRREFGYRLKRAMENKGIRQSELSARTGIHQPRISCYVQGKTEPTFSVACKIAKAIGCNTDEFCYKDFEEDD